MIDARPRILLVEDDGAIRLAIREKLSRAGYDVDAAADGEAARDRFADRAPDLVVLDLMLPRLDGLSVLRWLRTRSTTCPVLILSAKDRESDKVEGLRAGADDYLTKPFGADELVARIEALLRRARGPQDAVHFGDVRVDIARRRVERAGREVVLSRTELELLAFLVRHRDRIVTRREILDAVWGHDAASTDRAVDYHVLNLRKKLEPDPATPRHIVTRHGLGYQLVDTR